MWQYKVGINANIANLFVKMSISQSQISVTHLRLISEKKKQYSSQHDKSGYLWMPNTDD